MSRQTHHVLGENELSSLVELVNSAYRGESSKAGWTTEADLLGGQRIDFAKAHEIFTNRLQQVLVWPSGQSVGPSLNACVLLERKGQKAYLGMLTVRPQLQNFGLGRKLLETSEAWVKENWQVSEVEMTVVSARTELIAWYERRGYRLTGERRPFPMTDERFGLPKVAHLEFVVLEKSL